ncbi:MAG: DUF2868 domain-containing protein [Deltaproteobacteria bacterium]|nr:DUF2868 domain-containing protein [Deltaproteobacteria bacterium]
MAHKFPFTRWLTEDVLDLEYFLHADKESGCDKETLKQRDRSIFGKIQANFAGKGDLAAENTPEARRYLIKNWLEARRGKPGDKQLPGELFHSTLTILKWAISILGALSGMGLALSLLQYDGKEPINIAYYIGLLIVLQFVIFILLLTFGMWRKLSARFFTSLWWDHLSRLLLTLKPEAHKAARHTSSELREQMYALCGQLRIHQSIYGNLFLLMLSPITLLFGLFFNVAALVVTLVKLFFTDLAFGWQSTLLSSDQVHRVAEIIALPWSWMKGIGLPTLEQVENSHIILKDGVFHLQTPDLTSWASFLCLGLLFYGVLPRILIWLLSLWKQRRALARLDFSHASCRKLLSRMRIPQDEPHPRTGTPGEENGTETDAQITTGEQPTPADVKGDMPSPEKENGEEAVVLLEEDLAADVSPASIQARSRHLFQLDIKEILKVGGSLKRERESLEQLQQRQWHSNGAVLLILSAWQPPIEEKLALLRKLRGLLPEHGRIILYLIGKPQPDNIFTPPKPTDYDIWNQRVMALGDPWLEIMACN